jgi:PAS domain S-box-containing protein
MHSERYHEIFEKANDAVFIIDKDSGEIISVNHKAVAITGYAFEELIDAHPLNFMSSNSAFSKKDFSEKVHSAITEGNPIFEWQLRKKDGNLQWITVNLTFAMISGIERVLYFFHRSDERKNIESVLRESEANYRNLFENNPVSIFIWNPYELKIIEANQTALTTYGYPKEEFINLSTLKLRPEEDLERYYKFLDFARSEIKESYASGIWRHITKSGEILFMDITSLVINYKGSSCILSVAMNATEKVLLEKKLEEERIKKQFEITDAVISAEERERQEIGRELHDNINQLLATASLYLSIYKDKIDSKVDSTINETDNLINTAINEIRYLSHSMISPFLGTIGLFNAVENLCERVSLGGNLKIQTDISNIQEGSLPEKLKLTVYRIIQEQLNNVVKHANAKSAIIKLIQDSDKLIISITDDGVGFDATQIMNGIGILNIHTRAEIFNGKVEIISSPGEGCELKVTFS